MQQPGGDDEAAGLALMEEAGVAIVAGVERLAAAWVVRVVTGIVDAWGRLDDAARDATTRPRPSGRRGRRGRVVGASSERSSRPIRRGSAPPRSRSCAACASRRRQCSTRRASPPVERDPFDARSFPDDEYAIVPRSLADLGDDELAPMLMAWGLGKARVLRARALRSGPVEP